MEAAVLGAGSWGTALAILLSGKGINVRLWGRQEDRIKKMCTARENVFYLPGIAFPAGLNVTADLEEAVCRADYIILSVPSHTVREVCRILKDYVKPGVVVVNSAKGIEKDTLKRLSQVMGEEFAGREVRCAVLSGPSHAEEVARNMPTAVVVGARDRETTERVQDLFMSPSFRVYTNPDLIGMELGGALKNVIALGTGITEGLGYGDNAKAALITRGAAEIARLGMAAGAHPLTFAGLTGIGDLIVTCTSVHSRNRRAGILIGQGLPLEQALAEVGMVVEGVKATPAACALSEKYEVSMPICTETYNVLFQRKNPRDAAAELMGRNKKHEVEEVVRQEQW